MTRSPIGRRHNFAKLMQHPPPASPKLSRSGRPRCLVTAWHAAALRGAANQRCAEERATKLCNNERAGQNNHRPGAVQPVLSSCTSAKVWANSGSRSAARFEVGRLVAKSLAQRLKLG